MFLEYVVLYFEFRFNQNLDFLKSPLYRDVISYFLCKMFLIHVQISIERCENM